MTLNETDWRREWDGEVVFSHFSRISGEVTLLFSRNFMPKSHVVEEVMRSRLMVVRAWVSNSYNSKLHLGPKQEGFLFSTVRLDRFDCFSIMLVLLTYLILPVGFSDHSMMSCNVFIANVKHKSAYTAKF